MARIDLKALPDRIAVGGLIVVVERGAAIAVFHRRCAARWVANGPTRQAGTKIAIGDAVADQSRTACITIDQIIAGPARKTVIPRAAQDNVITSAGYDDILAIPRFNVIGLAAATD